jgi:hypothetical protein
VAAYRYIRQTDDIELGVHADLPTLRRIVTSLHESGFAAVLREPDGDDPLGGVIDVTGSFGLVQIVSYADRFPIVIEDAVRGASLVVREGSPLRIVPLPQLVALKLYAGGMKSKSDIVELLARNPDCDLAEVERVCTSYRLRGNFHQRCIGTTNTRDARRYRAKCRVVYRYVQSPRRRSPLWRWIHFGIRTLWDILLDQRNDSDMCQRWYRTASHHR